MHEHKQSVEFHLLDLLNIEINVNFNQIGILSNESQFYFQIVTQLFIRKLAYNSSSFNFHSCRFEVHQSE